MDDRLNRVASLANDVVYGNKDAKSYIDGAPHIKHAVLRKLYGSLLLEVYDAAAQHHETPTVLDLGAGEGSVTRPFLELGARVVAIDISRRQLDELSAKCADFGDRLEIRCEDINESLQDQTRQYDIVVANSFLHHVPDYLALLRQAIPIISPQGLFFSFQDPLRYDTVGWCSRLLTETSYFFWRLSRGRRGDVIGGIKRRFRRKRGIYLEDSLQDSVEYHVVRNGVDQAAIRELFHQSGFDCRIVPYFSTQNTLFQPIGTALSLTNTFAVIASRGINSKPHSSQEALPHQSS